MGSIQNSSSAGGAVSSNMGGGGGSMGQSSSAGPASGKYSGFGSEDINRLGYNNQNKFNAPYDPYTKG